MKRFFALALLVTASVQANDLSDAWHNVGKSSRIASGVKALAAGVGTLAAVREVIRHTPMVGSALKEAVNAKNVVLLKDSFATSVVIAGSTLYTAYVLGYHYFPKHIKHAFNVS